MLLSKLLRNDVTQQFTITATKNTVKFAAANSFLKTDAACNNVTYYFRIHVKAKADSVIAAHGHYKDGIYYHISNQAKRRLDSSQMADTQETNMSWVRGIIERNCSIRKTDAADSTKDLTGAVFQAYAWDEQKKSYAITGEQFAYTEKTKLYTKTAIYRPEQRKIQTGRDTGTRRIPWELERRYLYSGRKPGLCAGSVK